MPRYKPIQIACPHYQRLVRGEYECDSRGRYYLGPRGTFLLHRVRCGHLGGRCAQTLCALHRHNRGGARTWFPENVVPLPQAQRAPAGRRAREHAPESGDGATFSLEA